MSVEKMRTANPANTANRPSSLLAWRRVVSRLWRLARCRTSLKIRKILRTRIKWKILPALPTKFKACKVNLDLTRLDFFCDWLFYF